ALASTADFRTFERHGVVFCPENKDVVLFPETISGAYAALHRPVCGTPFTRPEIWVARSPDLIHWGAHAPLAVPGGEWQSARVGATAGPDPRGCARPRCRRGRRVAIRRGGGRDAAGPRPWRLAGDLSREPPPDPAGRGRGLLRRDNPPRCGRSGQGAAVVPRAV